MPVYIQAVQAERPSIQPSGAPLQPLFADCADVELLAYGVPVEWLDDVKQATAATLFALVDHLPAEAAEALLQKFGLVGFGDRYPSQLSGGMKRRAELAQALINSPKVMILDEPFRGLDVMTRELMQEYYVQLFEETQLTTLFITTELEEAIFLADRIVFMGTAPGRIVRGLEVDLPHPRTIGSMTSERYLEIKKDAMATLIEYGAVSTD